MMDELHPEPVIFNLPDEAFVDAVVNDRTAHHKATGAHYSSAWIKGPGAVTLLAEAFRDLLTVSALRGQPTNQIPFVSLLALSSLKTLLVWPSTENDLAAEQVKMDGSTATFIASSILRSAKIPVESGKRIRYKVHILKESKVGPALAIDMRTELDVRLLPKRKYVPKGKRVKEQVER